jgi:hypothetical protein
MCVIQTVPLVAYLVDQQLGDTLLLDVNNVLAKELFSAVALVGIEPSSHDFRIGPGRILPAIDHDEFILNRVVAKSQISVIKEAERRNSWIAIFIVDVTWGIHKNCRKRASVRLATNFVDSELIPLILCGV